MSTKKSLAELPQCAGSDTTPECGLFMQFCSDTLSLVCDTEDGLSKLLAGVVDPALQEKLRSGFSDFSLAMEHPHDEENLQETVDFLKGVLAQVFVEPVDTHSLPLCPQARAQHLPVGIVRKAVGFGQCPPFDEAVNSSQFSTSRKS